MASGPSVIDVPAAVQRPWKRLQSAWPDTAPSAPNSSVYRDGSAGTAVVPSPDSTRTSRHRSPGSAAGSATTVHVRGA